MTFLIHEMFDTDLDDMMACYQTGYSSFGLPTPKKTFDDDSNKFSSNIIIFFIYDQAALFFLLLRNIDCCDRLRNDVPNIVRS